ncbi:MAG: LuxR C-terminal-related transcriptional regulator, partial [Chloroflexota bacterium]
MSISIMADNQLPKHDLTVREIEILGLVADGLTNREIADQTQLTLDTIKWYLKQIYSKLHVGNRTQAAAKAREMKLIGYESQPQAAPTRLPSTTTPFLGRGAEVTTITTLIQDSPARLVTIHGIGGMGKTRLALEVAQQLEPQFSDGVLFVSLAQVTYDPLLAIAHAVRLPITDPREVMDRLGGYLHNKKLLLVLDNFEHLTDHAISITKLLERTRKLRLLVTSREKLHLTGEHIYPLEGMPVDEDPAHSGVHQLFLLHARSVNPLFQPTHAEISIISEICKLLGGMPLAIEIAARWSSVLSVDEIHEHLSDNLDLLATDERDRPARQQSVRVTFDYSLKLLDHTEQEMLLLLGIFHPDGFSAQAAQAVAGAGPLQIKRLFDASLIKRGHDGRFGFHPLIRQYVEALLHQNTNVLNTARTRYLGYYRHFATTLIQGVHQSIDLGQFVPLVPEWHNFSRAWEFAVRSNDFDWLLDVVEIGYVCEIANLWAETNALLAGTLSILPSGQEILRGRMLAVYTLFTARAADITGSRASANESWSLLAETEYTWDAISAMCQLAITEAAMGDHKYAFDILNTIEEIEGRQELYPNRYIETIRSCVRPIVLYFTGYVAEAFPLLQTMAAPSWHEFRGQLCECYLELGMIDEARDTLEDLFDAALANNNPRIFMGCTYYLTQISSSSETLLIDLVQSFVELPRLKISYPMLAGVSHYYALQLCTRRHLTWGMLLFRTNLYMLRELEAFALMYQYTLSIAIALTEFHRQGSAEILLALVEDLDCP